MKRVKRVFVSAVASVLLVSMSGTGLAKTYTVKALSKDAWKKVHTYIGAGDSVKWKNPDSEMHDLTSYNGKWVNTELQPGDSFKKKFKKKKTYFYRCVIHSGIVGGKCQGMCGFVHVL
ncbi:MAG: cupredoxin domain-containing protein [Actinomycetota bacterium]